MTKKDKLKRCKELLYKNLTNSDKRWLYLEVFKGHYCIDEIVGCGVADIIVCKPENFTGLCFHIVRKDGTKKPISYIKCVNGFTKKNEVTKVLRGIVQPQIAEFRRLNNTPYNMDVDHYGIEFKDIVNLFMIDKSYDKLYKIIIKSDKVLNYFSDSELSLEFYNLHKSKATLQALTQQEHKKKTYNL